MFGLMKTVLKALIALPLTIFSLIGMLGGILDGDWGKFFGWFFVLGGFYGICIFDLLLVHRRNGRTVKQRGLVPDYQAIFQSSGVVLDLKAKQLLVGDLKRSPIIGFDNVRTVEKEDTLLGRSKKYLLHVSTNDFQHPRLSIGFAADKSTRDEAYEKIRVAIQMSS